MPGWAIALLATVASTGLLVLLIRWLLKGAREAGRQETLTEEIKRANEKRQEIHEIDATDLTPEEARLRLERLLARRKRMRADRDSEDQRG